VSPDRLSPIVTTDDVFVPVPAPARVPPRAARRRPLVPRRLVCVVLPVFPFPIDPVWGAIDLEPPEKVDVARVRALWLGIVGRCILT